MQVIIVYFHKVITIVETKAYLRILNHVNSPETLTVLNCKHPLPVSSVNRQSPRTIIMPRKCIKYIRKISLLHRLIKRGLCTSIIAYCFSNQMYNHDNPHYPLPCIANRPWEDSEENLYLFCSPKPRLPSSPPRMYTCKAKKRCVRARALSKDHSPVTLHSSRLA